MAMSINFEEVFENSPIALLILENPSGRILRSNRTAETFLGVSATQLSEFLWGDLLKDIAKDKVLWTDGLVRELELISPLGATLFCDAAFNLLGTDQGDSLMVALMPCDERLKTQNERESLAIEKQRELKLKALGRLAGGMAHDFNNLLTVIAGNLELLADTKDIDKALLDDCNSSLERAQDLAQQILQFSKTSMAPRGELNLRDSLESICSMLRRAWGDANQPVFDCNLNSAWIELSAGEFEAAVMNLLTNAKESSEDRELSICVGLDLFRLTQRRCFLRGVLDPGEYVCVSVEDNGVGISDELVEQIFEPYFSTKQQKGSGIGLSRVEGLMQSVGGAIDMESQPGFGTRWTLIFPMSQKTQQKTEGAEASDISEGPMIAIVDDEPSIVRLVGRVLDREGYRSKGFSQPSEALDYLSKSDDPFVLVTDAKMPGLSGRALTDALRSAHKNFSALLLSGYSDELAGKESLFDERLQKPVRVKQLVDAVQRLCRSVRDQRS